jgi:hypothetical protein
MCSIQKGGQLGTQQYISYKNYKNFFIVIYLTQRVVLDHLIQFNSLENIAIFLMYDNLLIKYIVS